MLRKNDEYFTEQKIIVQKHKNLWYNNVLRNICKKKNRLNQKALLSNSKEDFKIY